MVKECKVIMRAPKVAVALFEEKEIQIPNSDLVGDVVWIQYENEKYTVVAKPEPEVAKPKKKSTKKKVETDIENNVENVLIDDTEIDTVDADSVEGE